MRMADRPDYRLRRDRSARADSHNLVKHKCVGFYRVARARRGPDSIAQILQARNESREGFGDSVELTHLLAADRKNKYLEVSYDEQAPRILRIYGHDRSFLCPRTRTFARCGEGKVLLYPECPLYPLFASAPRMQMAY